MDTDDSILRDAEARRDVALAEARRWEEFIRLFHELRGRGQNKGGGAVNSGGTSPPSAEPPASQAGGLLFPSSPDASTAPRKPQAEMPQRIERVRQGDAVGAKVLETEALAREIIMEREGPVPTREMLAAMTARGFEIGGVDPFATLMTRLQRAPTLENFKPHGWRIKAGQ